MSHDGIPYIERIKILEWIENDVVQYIMILTATILGSIVFSLVVRQCINFMKRLVFRGVERVTTIGGEKK